MVDGIIDRLSDVFLFLIIELSIFINNYEVRKFELIIVSKDKVWLMAHCSLIIKGDK